MDVFSSFKMTIDEKDYLKALEDYLEENADGEVNAVDGAIEVEESYNVLYTDDAVDMAKNIVALFNNVHFQIEGTTDCNGNEFQNFRISFDGEKLITEVSSWYNIIEEDEDGEELDEPLYIIEDIFGDEECEPISEVPYEERTEERYESGTWHSL